MNCTYNVTVYNIYAPLIYGMLYDVRQLIRYIKVSSSPLSPIFQQISCGAFNMARISCRGK